MQTVEDRLVEILSKAGVDTILALPCDRVKWLLKRVSDKGNYVPLTREEEGVGIAAGVAMAGGRTAMIIQSSGFGNMINALLSLTGFYKLPLAIFISHRGIYKEKIEAQKPMGRALKGLLKASGIGYTLLDRPDDLRKIENPLMKVYMNESTHAFLLSPRLWEGCGAATYNHVNRILKTVAIKTSRRTVRAKLTRYEIIAGIKDILSSEIVICNLGIPSKELYHIVDQPSNFYMLGSMGMVTPIGLGVALKTDKRVFVIDGDGSLLMNSGILATVAYLNPDNLTIIAIDNGVYGSTGNQPTHSFSIVDLSVVARGFGIRNAFQCSRVEEIKKAVKSRSRGVKFIHVIAKPGNARVDNIPLSALEIKERFINWLRGL